jgi:hypothetical protein
MIKEAIEKILSLAPNEMITDMFGREWSTKELHEFEEPVYPLLTVDTLTGFIDYVKEVVKTDNVFLFVESPFRVMCLGLQVIKPNLTRGLFGGALYEYHGFQFNNFVDLERFIIDLQVMFEQDDNTAKILKIVGNLADSSVTTFSDDGVSQAVASKTTLTKVENVEIPRIIELAPWRTFREIEQPKSKFIFRMRQQKEQPPACALFDVGGDLWKIEAMEKIKAYLEEKLPGILVIA